LGGKAGDVLGKPKIEKRCKAKTKKEEVGGIYG